MSEPLECIACWKTISRDGRLMRCSECRHSYHLGQCSGIADNTFTTMGPSKREKWRCRTCRAKEGRGGADVSSQEESSVVLVQLKDLNEKIDSLMSIKANVETLLGLPSKVEELMSLKPTVERLQNTVGEVQKAVEFLSNRYDTLLLTVSENERKMKELKAESDGLKAAVSAQALAIQRLQHEANDSEQYSRLANMEISGMPVSPRENLTECVRVLADKLALTDFQTTDILAIHRLPAKRDSTPVVLIRFASVGVKDRWMGARAKLRSLVESGTTSKLYFNENLTRANKELFWLARTRGKEKRFKYVWVKGGKIFAKKNESAPLVRIIFPSDVDKIA